MKTVLILGSSGLVGSTLLNQLCNHSEYNKIILLNRKSIPINHPKVTEIITDFKSPIDFSSVDRIDSVFSCLGTTRKKTPDLEIYRFIEIGIPQTIMEQLKNKDVQQFHTVSAIGAKAESKNFYLKIKGEAENGFEKFDVKNVSIYHPAMLRGDRKEFILLEKISYPFVRLLDALMKGDAEKYHSTHVEELAEAMIRKDLQPTTEKINRFTYPYL